MEVVKPLHNTVWAAVRDNEGKYEEIDLDAMSPLMFEVEMRVREQEKDWGEEHKRQHAVKRIVRVEITGIPC